jgi:hypothetical protein
MRRILGSCVLLAVSAPWAYAQNQPVGGTTGRILSDVGQATGVTPPTPAGSLPGTTTGTTPAGTYGTTGQPGWNYGPTTGATTNYYPQRSGYYPQQRGYYPQQSGYYGQQAGYSPQQSGCGGWRGDGWRGNWANARAYPMTSYQSYPNQGQYYTTQSYYNGPFQRRGFFGFFRRGMAGFGGGPLSMASSGYSGPVYSATPGYYTTPGQYAAPGPNYTGAGSSGAPGYYQAPGYGTPAYYGNNVTHAAPGTVAPATTSPSYTPTMYNAPTGTPLAPAVPPGTTLTPSTPSIPGVPAPRIRP